MEPIFKQEWTVNDSETDCFGCLLPSMALRLIQGVSAGHSDALGTDYDTLAEKGMFWAVIRHRVKIFRLPHAGEKITLETWPLPTTRVAFPRATVAYDEQGQVLFQSMALWILMDLESRAMILPKKSGIVLAGTLRGTELPAPTSLAPHPLPRSHRRQVRYTDLDRNRHMNNARYLDWIDDLLDSRFHESHAPVDMTLCYLNEAREGQELELTWDVQDSGLLVDIHREREAGDFDRIFAAHIVFDSVVL